MTPLELIDKVRLIQARDEPEQASFAVLSETLSAFVREPANRRMEFPRATTGLYTRLLLNDPSDPFQIVLVLWGPGSESPIHDHSSTIGAVGALAGMTYETKYEISVRDGAEWLREGQTIRLVDGRITPILPDEANQLHAMVNPRQHWAGTVHVYLTPITEFFIYHRGSDGRFQRERRQLWFDGDNAWRFWKSGAVTGTWVPDRS